MTRRRWHGAPGGVAPPADLSVRLGLVPLAAGQPVLQAQPMSGAGGLSLPMVPLWSPPPLSLPEPPEPQDDDLVCFDVTAPINAPYRLEWPIEGKTATARACYRKSKIQPVPGDDWVLEYYPDVTGWTFGADVTVAANMDGQALDGTQSIPAGYAPAIYFQGSVPVIFRVDWHEEGDLGGSGEPYVDLAEPCAMQAGIQGELVPAGDGVYTLGFGDSGYDDEYWGTRFWTGAWFVYWDDLGGDCPE